MTTGGRPAGLATRRAAITAARAALSDLSQCLWEASGAELTALLNDVDALAARAAAARVAVVAEAVERGEIATSQAASTTAWVAEHAPSLRAGGAGLVARAVDACRHPRMAALKDALLAGVVGVPAAVTVSEEFDRLRHRLLPDAADSVLGALVAMGADHGSRGVRMVRPRLLAQYGAPGELQRDHDKAASLVSLSQPVPEGDSYGYHLVLDAEGKAVLEASIGPLSAPSPDDEGGRDRRTSAQRRGQALVEVCRRATAAGAIVAAGVKSTLLVTMSYDDLRDRLSAGATVGGPDADTLLSPETVRRLACDAAVIPAVLAGPSQVLDLGETQRFFQPTQSKALWLRDRHCTFPGCTTPAHWCHAHHIRHWADGGPTDMSNAALLCGRHHQIAHRDRLTARVSPEGRVDWDTRPGSYDLALATGPPQWTDPASDSLDAGSLKPPAGSGPTARQRSELLWPEPLAAIERPPPRPFDLPA